MAESDSQRLSAERWRRVEEAFHALLEAPVGDRAARLDQIVDGDRELASEVLSLIEYDRESADFGVDALPARSRVDAMRSAGELVGQYRLLVPLVISHASEVWCAEQVPRAESSGAEGMEARRFAIKFLRATPDDRKRWERFRNEVLYMSRFRHPGIAELVDYGQVDSLPYFVMPYIPGLPITRFADNRKLTIAQRCELIVQICDAVSYAHRYLIVHRDLKPANLLVSVNNVGDFHTTVLDFGISKYLGQTAGAPASQQLTATQDRPMTPAYASPEQLRGEPVTTATDGYALGLVLYELLTGHQPYSAGPHPQTEMLFDRICSSMPLRPSRVALCAATPLEDSTIGPYSPSHAGGPESQSPEQLASIRGLSRRQLSRELERYDQFFERALAKSPEVRFPSIADFRNELQKCSRESRDGSMALSPRFVRRRPRTALLAAALCGALFSAGLAALYSHFVPFGGPGETARSTGTSMPASPPASGQRTAVDDERAISALQAIAAQRFSDATTIIQSFAGQSGNFDLSRQGRMTLAQACIQLGRPTTGLRAFGSLPTEPQARTQFLQEATDSPVGRARFRNTIVRLLLDAGRSTVAHDWYESLPLSINGGDSTEDEACNWESWLVGAEVRHAIGWSDGKTALLQRLIEANCVDRLPASDRARFLVMQADREDASRFSQSLEQWLSVADADNLPDAIAQGRAILEAARIDVRDGNLQSAAARFERIVSLFDRMGQASHVLALQALNERIWLAYNRQDAETAGQLRRRYWQIAQSTGEYGTKATMQVVGRVMHFDVQPNEVFEILGTLEPHALVYREDPYLHREMLEADFRASFSQQLWTRGEQSVQPLCEMEKELWGEDSLQYAFVLAAHAYALQQLGRQPEAQTELETVQKITAQLLRTAPDGPAKGFLRPAISTHETSAYAAYEWIDLYQRHRHNSKEVQEQMIDYYVGQVQSQSPDDARLLREESDSE